MSNKSKMATRSGFKEFRLKCAVVLMVFLSFNILMDAQSTKVTGTISDKLGPLVGATVSEKGTTNGTITDGNGKFSIQAHKGSVLVFSYVGYKDQEFVADKSVYNVILQDNNETLDEVVVVGYGVQKKKLVTGATVQLKGDQLQRRSTTSALQALQGQTPGVNIASTSGQPGEGLKVTVRGLGTIGDASPLYIVDGVQTGDISYLNNSDIESIDVLKDAASAAIYGSRAANGVVLVTTKKGKVGKDQITFDAYVGVQNRARKIDLLNATQYAMIRNEAAINSGNAPVYSQDEMSKMGTGTNWLDQMFVSNAPTQNYSLGLQGGNDKGSYSMSTSYTDQAGIVGGAKYSNYERYGFRINSDHKLYGDILKVGENLTFTYTNKVGIQVGNFYSNSLIGAFRTTPLVPMYGADGNFYDNVDNNFNGGSNPYAHMVYNSQNIASNQKLIGNIYVELQPIKRLKIRSSFGLDNGASTYRGYVPQYHLSVYDQQVLSSVTQNSSRGLTWNLDNTISYSYDLKSDHHFDAMLGNSVRQYTGEFLQAQNSDLVFNDFQHAYISNAVSTTKMAMQGYPNDKDVLLSYFGRIGYNYKETYLFNATLRADGSSKFAPGHRWGYFPSVSAGWVVTNEKFMESTKSWMDFLKLRASWGQNGNQNISSFNYLALIGFNGSTYNFGNTEGPSGDISGAYPSRMANANLKWETSEQLDFGFDSRFLDGKMNATFDWYKKSTKDWLVQAPILATAGTGAPYINGGNVINQGIEAMISYSDKIGKVNYTITGNIAKNKNRVTEVPGDIIHGATTQIYDGAPEFYRVQTGFPVGYFIGYKTAGVFQNEAQIQNYKSKDGRVIQPNAKPGDVIYQDLNGDGVIGTDDETMIGDPNPHYTFGLSLTCSYNGWDFMVSTNGVAGNQIFQSYRNLNATDNYTTAILDRWHGEGTSNRMPRVTEDNLNWTKISDLSIHNGSYWRINNVTLGYDLNKLIKTKFLGQLRIYGSVQNLFTFTKYDGMDPEVGYGMESFASGIDNGYYPHPRTTLIGINVKF